MFFFGLTTVIAIIIGFAVFIFVIGSYEGMESWAANKYRNRIEFFEDKFEKMFIKDKWPIERIYILSFGPFVACLLLGVIMMFLSNMHFIVAIVLTALICIIAWVAPKFIVGFLFNRRVAKFDAQLVDCLAMLGNTLKSGLSFLQGMQLISKNMPNPVSQEFQLVLHQQQIGSSIDEALESLGERIPSDDLHMVVSSITILRETGGDLTETFDTLTNTIRERKKIDGKIKSLTHLGLFQGAMLSCLPFALAGMFYLSNPDEMKLFVTTPIGLGLTIAACCIIGLAFFVIKKIVTIDI
ncbi:MAG: type II secretion system F family protein [Pseudomonadota bacterium]